MSVSEYPKKVYKEDGEGNTYCLQETVYRGKTIHYNSAFPEPSYVLDNLLSLKSKDSDVWLVTFPRSGTHWMYEILTVLTSGKLAPSSVPMAERDVTLRSPFERKDDEVVPMIHVAHLKHKYIPSQVFKQQKVIYVIRNPKSVAVSYYSLRCRLSAFEYSGTFSGFLPTFFENPITLFGNWFEHVTQYWTALKNHPNVLFVCYEDLMRIAILSAPSAAQDSTTPQTSTVDTDGPGTQSTVDTGGAGTQSSVGTGGAGGTSAASEGSTEGNSSVYHSASILSLVAMWFVAQTALTLTSRVPHTLH